MLFGLYIDYRFCRGVQNGGTPEPRKTACHGHSGSGSGSGGSQYFVALRQPSHNIWAYLDTTTATALY